MSAHINNWLDLNPDAIAMSTLNPGKQSPSRSPHSGVAEPQGELWSEHALLPGGWASNVTVRIDQAGRIESAQADTAKSAQAVRCGVLLPAIANVHSHSFQRALAGLTEARGANASDSFWTWRDLMYRFLEQLDPDDIEAIGAYVFMETQCAGFSAIGEFHYLHHQPDGRPYTNLSETSQRLAAAAAQTGIGLTLLPVLYQQGGCDGRALNASQQRFFNSQESFARLHDEAARAVALVSDDCTTGVAPHSLRAVKPEALRFIQTLAPDAPVHLHIAEQSAEVDEVLAHQGQRPVQWLLDHQPVDQRWCLVHATQMTAAETLAMARSGAVAGLCPITEANLGDGIFNGAPYLAHGGAFGIGSDSNIRISLVEELRLLEYSQRLRDRSRAVLAGPEKSTGRTLYEAAATGGAQATGRNAGVIAKGKLADLLALDTSSIALTGLQGDNLLDSFLFAGTDELVTHVWSAGRHVVADGRHVHATTITRRYRQTIDRLRALL